MAVQFTMLFFSYMISAKGKKVVGNPLWSGFQSPKTVVLKEASKAEEIYIIDDFVLRCPLVFEGNMFLSLLFDENHSGWCS